MSVDYLDLLDNPTEQAQKMAAFVGLANSPAIDAAAAMPSRDRFVPFHEDEDLVALSRQFAPRLRALGHASAGFSES